MSLLTWSTALIVPAGTQKHRGLCLKRAVWPLVIPALRNVQFVLYLCPGSGSCLRHGVQELHGRLWTLHWGLLL